MQLPVTRRLRPREDASIGPLALLGFGAGLAAGFLLSEFFGQSGSRRVSRLVKSVGARRSGAESLMALAARVKGSLEADRALGLEGVAPRPSGRDAVALHGWAPTRSARTRAWRLAQSLAAGIPILNHLLVRGEDDIPSEPGEPGEPRIA